MGTTTKATLTGVFALAAGLWSAGAFATEDLGFMTLTGYLRQDFSFNLDTVPEAKSKPFAPQMNRQTAFVEAFAPVGETRWTTRLRYDHEFLTPYEHNLQDTASTIIGRHVDFSKEYEPQSFGDVIRELFVDYDIGRLSARIGRQQVVWGETDFFHATDVIHGYDFRWRSFLEPANEDVRKPLSMVNITADVRELNGKMQFLVRPPGIDRDSAIGNSDPTFGGRWSNNFSKGVPLGSVFNPSLAEYNYHWRDGNVDNPDYGARWTGSAGPNGAVNYSLSYYHGQSGFMQDPILIFNPAAKSPLPLQFVFPFTDTYGASATGYIGPIDSVYRVEGAITPHRKLATVTGNVVEETGYNFVAGLDHTLRLENLINTSSQSLFTFQVFDWFLPGVTSTKKIVRFDGAGFWSNHNVYSSAILQLPYLHDTLTVTLVGLVDMTWGGGMFIPSAEYAIGDRWRLKAELDLPIDGKVGNVSMGQNASTFGAFQHNTQLLLRTTFLF